MRVNRPNQSDLARTLASAASSGQAALLPGEMPETVLEIPAALVPSIEMCRPLRRGTGMGATTPEEQSVGQTFFNTASNGVPLTATLMTLRAGIWRIYLGFQTITRTAAAAIGVVSQVLIADPAQAYTGMGIAFDIGALLNVPQNATQEYLVHLAEDGYSVQVVVDDPAVATSVVKVCVQVFACRLI